MKKTRKWLSVALALVLVLLLAPVVLPTAAEATETTTGNVSITVDNPNAKVGDIVTVTLHNEEMTVSAFVCGLTFDKTKLECTKIGELGSNVTKDAKLIDPQLSTKDQANSTGKLGFGVVYVDATSPDDKVVAAGDFLTVKFKVLTAGEITVNAYESSCKADTTSLIDGNVDSVKITASAASGSKIGDVNNDGNVSIADLDRLYAHLNGKNPLPAADLKRGDVNGDNNVSIADLDRLYAHLNGKNPLF